MYNANIPVNVKNKSTAGKPQLKIQLLHK